MENVNTSIKAMNRVPLTDWQKGMGPVSLDNRKLAGDKPKDTGNYVDKVQKYLNGLFDTAKNVKIKSDMVLPWENDREGKLLSTPSQQRDEKIKHLRTLLGLKQDGPLVKEDFGKNDAEVKDWTRDDPKRLFNPDDSAPSHLTPKQAECLCSAAAKELIELETEKHIDDKENQFQNDFINWVIGQGKAKEYEKCWWIPKQYTVDEIKQLEEAGEFEKASMLRKERGKLFEDNPALYNGLIESKDILPFKIKVFLDKLYGTPPKSMEEFLLWYKYIINAAPLEPQNFIDFQDVKDVFRDFFNVMLNQRGEYGAKLHDIKLLENRRKLVDREIEEQEQVERIAKQVNEFNTTMTKAKLQAEKKEAQEKKIREIKRKLELPLPIPQPKAKGGKATPQRVPPQPRVRRPLPELTQAKREPAKSGEATPAPTARKLTYTPGPPSAPPISRVPSLESEDLEARLKAIKEEAPLSVEQKQLKELTSKKISQVPPHQRKTFIQELAKKSLRAIQLGEGNEEAEKLAKEINDAMEIERITGDMSYEQQEEADSRNRAKMKAVKKEMEKLHKDINKLLFDEKEPEVGQYNVPLPEKVKNDLEKYSLENLLNEPEIPAKKAASPPVKLATIKKEKDPEIQNLLQQSAKKLRRQASAEDEEDLELEALEAKKMYKQIKKDEKKKAKLQEQQAKQKPGLSSMDIFNLVAERQGFDLSEQSKKELADLRRKLEIAQRLEGVAEAAKELKEEKKKEKKALPKTPHPKKKKPDLRQKINKPDKRMENMLKSQLSFDEDNSSYYNTPELTPSSSAEVPPIKIPERQPLIVRNANDIVQVIKEMPDIYDARIDKAPSKGMKEAFEEDYLTYRYLQDEAEFEIVGRGKIKGFHELLGYLWSNFDLDLKTEQDVFKAITQIITNFSHKQKDITIGLNSKKKLPQIVVNVK
jgi:hypothetical protein